MRGLSAMENKNDWNRAMLLADSDPPQCKWAADNGNTNFVCGLSQSINNLHLGDSICPLPVPVPTDNYVADLRTNKFDSDPSQNPRIEIKAKLEDTGSQQSSKSSWINYANAPLDVQKQINFNIPGVYDLSILATDYERTAQCDGCVAIRDMFRPRFGTATTCPSISDQTLTQASFNSFVTAEHTFDSYVGNANIINNNQPTPSAGLCGSDKMTTKQNFYESSETSASCCFDSSILSTNVGRLKTNPLTNSLQCNRDSLETTLNGKYTPYPTTPTSSCEGGDGIPNSCSIHACLMAKGNDIVAAPPADLASIKTSVQAASQRVLDALPSAPADSDVLKNVFYSIPCTSYSKADTTCKYSAKLSQLLDVTTLQKVTAFPAVDDINNFIFWRYNTNAASWNTWVPTADSVIDFTDKSTTVTIEVWTACGIVATYSFNVKLVLHSTLACSGSGSLWKPASPVNTEGAVCTLGDSDFGLINAVLTEDDIKRIVPHSDETVTGTLSDVSCTIMVKDPLKDTDTQPKTFMHSTSTFNNYFAVELVHDPTTARKTTAQITCTFTRTPRVNLAADTSMLATGDAAASDHTITCPPHTITFTDCDTPEMFLGKKSDSCLATCAGNSNPGEFEACGGLVITSSATETIVKPEAESTCCAGCNPALTCNNILTGMSQVDTKIKRCEPPPPGTPAPGVMLAETADAEQFDLTSTTTMALLGASAMVAVVALFVAKRRADSAACAAAEDSAYYALLE
ncbi:hypothetical protein JM18_009724 [Phytophthora kernoviae]|uniref:Uncharacterized protein n=1 Tax=Phytophthora kernoviae TaxID=325452 RepID=A0A8T0LH77_9STRA|nr:hypothetical protein JM16_009712 [Phytophthora kernoviae]KAG2502668.1 hypothetical protein JM18_009724 [Phytophthora kernoviae]